MEVPPAAAVPADVVILQTKDYRVHIARPGVFTVENDRGEIVARELDASQLQAAYPALARRLGGSFARLDAGFYDVDAKK